jgi:uncharacterized iron-regulated membrane protein
MSSVPGSFFRRALFWVHLSVGIACGLLVLLMSVTGVLLTYEHQMVESAARRNHVAVTGDATVLTADRLAAIAGAEGPARVSLVFTSESGAPVIVQRGREATLHHPVTGALIEDASAPRRGFFRVVEDWHRWLGGERGSTRAALNPAANGLFLFLLASGAYLWLPAVWRWRTLRGLLLFRKSYINAKVRDFAWHHVFGAWALLPLLLIVASGLVFSYPWANRAVFAAFGEAPPQRGGPPGGAAAGAGARDAAGAGADAGQARASLEDLRRAAAGAVEGWERLTLSLPAGGQRIDVPVELPTTGSRAPRRIVTLDTRDARVLSVSPVLAAGPGPEATPGQRARTWLRFIHTGEQYGIVGQTLAGLASLAACFLVYTGIALAYRRLIRPLFRAPAAG